MLGCFRSLILSITGQGLVEGYKGFLSFNKIRGPRAHQILSVLTKKWNKIFEHKGEDCTVKYTAQYF